MPPKFDEALERRWNAAVTSDDLLALFNFERLAMYATPVAGLPARTKYVYDSLRATTIRDDPGALPFQGASVHLVEVDPALVHRAKVASVLIRLDQDPLLRTGNLSHLRYDPTDSFGSSTGLNSGLFTADAYVAPLLGALAPDVWGFGVTRTFGSLIFGFGRSIPGVRGDAAEMLQMITVPGRHVPSTPQALSGTAATEAIDWWGRKLNLLFGVLSDFAVFAGPSGDYRPDVHLEAMLTIEQIFRRTTSIQLADRDTNARRPLLFSVLDSVQRANAWDLVTMCSLPHAERILTNLESSMSVAAQQILLPMARRGVEALRLVQEGFFMRRQLNTQDVELHLPDGTIKALSPETAAAQYLKLLRDATHGHGGRGKAADQTAALLAHHNGDVPHDVGLLAYLYLLDLLANPERLRRCLSR